MVNGQPRNGVAKVDEAAGTANPNWVAPLLGSTDLSTLMVFGSQVYVAGTVRVGAMETWPVASFSTVNNNAGLDIDWHPVPAGGVQSLGAAGSTVYIGSGAFIDNVPQPAITGVDAANFPAMGLRASRRRSGAAANSFLPANRRAYGRLPPTALRLWPVGRSRTWVVSIGATSLRST